MARVERSGVLGHLAQAQPRSKLRLRQPRRLPRGLDNAETKALAGSFKTYRDKAIAGLMLFGGLRSAEVLSLAVSDIDMGKGWIRVLGKGAKERRVPLDIDVGSLIQAYLLAERPETTSKALFVVAKGPHRGQPLTRAGLRTSLCLPQGENGCNCRSSPCTSPHLWQRSRRGRTRLSCDLRTHGARPRELLCRIYPSHPIAYTKLL